LGLDVDDLGGWKVEFYDRNTSGFEVREEPNLGRKEEEKRATFGVGATSCTTYAVNVVSWIVWCLKLDDPVYIWDL